MSRFSGGDPARRAPTGQSRGLTRAALIVVAVMTAAGCGLRVDHTTVQAANQAAVSGGGGGAGGGQNATLGGALTGSGASAGNLAGSSAGATATSGGGTTGAAVNAGTGSAATKGTGGVAAAAPPEGNGGATDVGVTGDQILVGNISDLGGPVPGLFQGGPYGTSAYFNYVNSQGGIYGRRLKLIADDDQLQCNQNEADYQDLVTKVFAFVGSWSLDDNCGATVLSHYPNVANVSQALTPPAQAVVGEINVSPFGAGAPNGPFLYYKQHDPADITKAGTLVGNQAAAVAAWHYARHAAESVGYKFIYEDDFPPAQNNFTADVVSMRSQGVQLVYIVAVNAPDLADFSAEANQQNWHPHLFASGVGYFGAYVQESSGPAAVEGQYVNTPDAMFLGEDAAVIPEVALFDQWMKNSYPDFPLDQFAATSWANSAMFVQALKMAGPHLTRAALLAALQTIHSFNDNGMVAPADPAGKVPTKCYIELVIHNGRYMRVDDPPSTFRCDGSYIPY